MAKVYKNAFFGENIVPIEQANVSVASSAVLYGLSVYTVFPVVFIEGKPMVFRIEDHFNRLLRSAKIIGINTFAEEWSFVRFKKAVNELIAANDVSETVFVRASVHVDELVPGTRSRGLHTSVSLFIYEAASILPETARIKTSVWRRIPDYAIPSRAKVNGAYVNSVLGKQDALDSGYDDCLFLDVDGHVCELSAANIFIVRDGVLSTPHEASDILEGINRKTILEIATELGIETKERAIDLTELYVADEVFACGTSAYITPIVEIDARKIHCPEKDSITEKIQAEYAKLFADSHSKYLTSLE